VQTLDTKDGLIPGALVGYETLTSSVNCKIKLFKDSHTKEHVLTEHHSCGDHAPSKHFHNKSFSNINFFYTAISIFSFCMLKAKQSKPVRNSRW